MVVDYSNASSTMLYDVRSKDWAAEMLSAADLDPVLLGRVAPADEVAGVLTEDAAREVGLEPGTKVVVGCGDEHGASPRGGTCGSDLICDITGTAEPVCAAADEPVFDETGLVETHAHADSRLWLIENPGFVSGGSIRWYSDNVARVGYDEMTREAVEYRPAPRGSCSCRA